MSDREPLPSALSGLLNPSARSPLTFLVFFHTRATYGIQRARPRAVVTPLPSEGAPGFRLAMVLRAASRPLNRAIIHPRLTNFGAAFHDASAEAERTICDYARPLIQRSRDSKREAGLTSDHDARGETAAPRRPEASKRDLASANLPKREAQPRLNTPVESSDEPDAESRSRADPTLMTRRSPPSPRRTRTYRKPQQQSISASKARQRPHPRA